MIRWRHRAGFSELAFDAETELSAENFWFAVEIVLSATN
jgi:hypothetical protein